METLFPKFDEFQESKVNESINDKYLLKAVMFLGPPAAGKSSVIDNLAANKEILVLSTDDFLERYVGKYAMLFPSALFDEKKKLKKLDLDKASKDELDLFHDLRAASKAVTKNRATYWINSLAALGVDGTGQHLDKIEEQASILRTLGYDLEVFFIDASLETCLARNKKRKRSMNDDVVTSIWKGCNENIKFFEKMFGSNFHYVNNDKMLDTKEFAEFAVKMYKVGLKYLNQPLQNPIGVELISKLKEIKGKYRSDLIGHLETKFKL